MGRDHYRRYVGELQHQTFFQITDKRWFYEQIIAMLEEDERVPDGYVADRSALDYWVIWQRWCWGGYSPEVTSWVYDRLLSIIRGYDRTLVLPPNPHPVYDGFRYVNPDYAVQYYALIQSFVSTHGLEYAFHFVDPGLDLDQTFTSVDSVFSQ